MTYQLSQQYPSRRVFITGGGGALGRALATLLSRDGWTVGITDISSVALDTTQKEIEASGAKCFAYQFDVSNKVAYKNAFDDFAAKNNGLDLIINNAGVGDGGLFGEYELEKWEWITGINQMAVVYGSHYAAQLMKKQRSGHILTISSVAGIACMPNMSMYNVTKAAVLALSESIYAELKPFGVNVSVALPEFFKSNIMQLAQGDANAVTIGKRKIEKAPFTAEEVAHVILKQAGAGHFYILHPTRAKWAFIFRNWFPRLFLKYKLREFAKKKWVQEALKKSI